MIFFRVLFVLFGCCKMDGWWCFWFVLFVVWVRFFCDIGWMLGVGVFCIVGVCWLDDVGNWVGVVGIEVVGGNLEVFVVCVILRGL